MTFSEIAIKVLDAESKSIEERTCPDQYVGIIGGFDQLSKDFPERKNVSSRPDDIPCLIMILESPHTDEFIGEVGPAKGTTGRLIRSHIQEMDCFSQFQDHGLILMNAIQYQCSLGYATECFRDRIFKTVWSDNGRSLFIKRLESYFRVGDVVANCCTRGYTTRRNEELRVHVQTAIFEALPHLDPMRRTHPSCWYSPKNRKAEWK